MLLLYFFSQWEGSPSYTFCFHQLIPSSFNITIKQMFYVGWLNTTYYLLPKESLGEVFCPASCCGFSRFKGTVWSNRLKHSLWNPSTIRDIGELLEFGLWGEEPQVCLGDSAGNRNHTRQDVAGWGSLRRGCKGIEGPVKQSHLKLSSWHPFSAVHRKPQTPNPNALWNWEVLLLEPGKRCLRMSEINDVWEYPRISEISHRSFHW